jgi:hypothetical protein
MAQKSKSGAHKGASAKRNSASPPKGAAQKKGRGKGIWIIGAVVVIVGIVAAMPGGNAVGQGAGVILPMRPVHRPVLAAGYEGPNVGGGIFSGAKEMTPIAATLPTRVSSPSTT